MRENILSTKSLNNKPPTWNEQKCWFVFLTNNTMKDSSGLLPSVGSSFLPPVVSTRFAYKQMQQARAGPSRSDLPPAVVFDPLVSPCSSLSHWPEKVLTWSSLIAGCETSHILKSCCVSVVVVLLYGRFFILCCCFCVCFVSLCIFLYLCWHLCFCGCLQSLWVLLFLSIVMLCVCVCCFMSLCLLFLSLCLYLSSSFVVVVVYCLPLVICVSVVHVCLFARLCCFMSLW